MSDLKFKETKENMFDAFGTDGELIQSIYKDSFEILEDCCNKLLTKLISLETFVSDDNLFKNGKFSIGLTWTASLIVNFLMKLTSLPQDECIDFSKKIMEKLNKKLLNDQKN